MRTNHHGRGIAAILIVTVTWVGFLLFTPVKAHGSDLNSAPYGGCKEAYSAPHSAAADECRAKGWTIRVNRNGRGIVVDQHAVPRYVNLPMCKWEDGSGQRSACTWNLGPRKQGNGFGVSYWVDTQDRIHYVWPMRYDPWHAVSPSLADVIAESDLPAFHWEQWRYSKEGGHLWLASPAGSLYTLY